MVCVLAWLLLICMLDYFSLLAGWSFSGCPSHTCINILFIIVIYIKGKWKITCISLFPIQEAEDEPKTKKINSKWWNFSTVRPSPPFLLRLASSEQPKFLAFSKNKEPNDEGKPNLIYEHCNSISRRKVLMVYPFCSRCHSKIFAMTSTTLFSAMTSLCQFGDHILLFPGSKTMMFAVLIAPFLCSLKS